MKDYRNDAMMLRQIIMDHYQYPRNHSLSDDESYLMRHMAADPCIDDIKVQVKIKEGVIEDVRFDGVACTISTASTSIMTELMKGKTLKDAQGIIAEYNKMIDLQEFDYEVLEEAIAFVNVGKQANRIGCATIGWQAMSEMILESEEEND